MSAFVQLNLEVWEARKAGELSYAEFELALYVAFETDFRTGRLTKTLTAIAADLGWEVQKSTTMRRLARVEKAGFIVCDVSRGHYAAHVIQPTARLLKTGRLATQARNHHATLESPDATLDATLETSLEAPAEAGFQAPGAESMHQSMQRPPIREEKRRSTQTAPSFLRSAETREPRPLIGDDDFPAWLASALERTPAVITELEAEQMYAAHEFVVAGERAAA